MFDRKRVATIFFRSQYDDGFDDLLHSACCHPNCRRIRVHYRGPTTLRGDEEANYVISACCSRQTRNNCENRRFLSMSAHLQQTYLGVS